MRILSQSLLQDLVVCNITHTQAHYKAKFKKSGVHVLVISTIFLHKKFIFNK